jgi:hypothetical protein
MATARIAAFVVAIAAVLPAQAPIDLLDTMLPPKIGLYGPKLPAARVVVLRSDDEARAFAFETFDDDRKELHVDFAKEQIVALCWGPRRVARDFRGGAPQMMLDRAIVADRTLLLTLRTMLPLGEHGEDADDFRLWYPAIFLRTPATGQVRVEVVGARCREQQTDFQPGRQGGLEVRVRPDSMPSRAAVELVGEQQVPVPADPAANVTLEPVDHGKRLVIDWGRHPGDACYPLDVTEVRIQDGVATVAVRATCWTPMLCSGPPELRPRRILDLPPVQRVVLRIERAGRLPPDDNHDFAPSNDKELSVEVDRSAAERVIHGLVR